MAVSDPEVDERLVAPGSRYEILDGQVVYVPPADEPHATCHATLAALLMDHRAEGYKVALDMLTRTSRIDDFAPDASVFPSARRQDGGRQLEELAFEIASTESLSHAGTKASKLIGRGVRRVFAIDLDRGRVVEWSRDLDAWSILDLRGYIVDSAFAVPLPIDALLNVSRSDDAVVRTFRQRRHPEFLAERNEGALEALRSVIVDVLASRGFVLDPSDRRRLDLEGRDTLQRWAVRAAMCATIAEMFGDG